jgi:PEP-CTERM motif
MKTIMFDKSRNYAPAATALLVAMFCGSAAWAGTVESCAAGNGPSGTNTVFPVNCTGDTSGTLEAWMSAPFSYTSTAGTTSGFVYSAVYDDDGTMDFYYQVVNNASSATAIAQLSAFDFVGFTTNAAFLTNGATLTGTTFENGTIAPQLTNVESGTTVNFDFNTPLATGVVGPGDASYVVIISTDATSYTVGGDSVQDGGSSGTLAAFQPSSGVPEPATLALMGLGLIVLASLRRRYSR